MKILFVTSNRLGDAVLSTGLLDHLLRTHPDARCTIVCGPVAEGLFARMPNLETTIVLRKRSWGLHWLPLWIAAVGRRWDLVVDIRGSALSWLVLTRRRAVFRRMRGPKIMQLAVMLGLTEPPLPVVWVSQADRDYVAALLPLGTPFVVFAPTANWAPKMWPVERFALLFDALKGSVSAGTVPVIVGGPGAAETAMAAPLVAALPKAVILVGQLSLPQVAAVLERAILFIGNDSGLMHLAAAAGAPTIGLFGPTDAATYAPVGPLTTAVVEQSMDDITVEQVAASAARLLSDSNKMSMERT